MYVRGPVSKGGQSTATHTEGGHCIALSSRLRAGAQCQASAQVFAGLSGKRAEHLFCISTGTVIRESELRT